MGEFCVSCGKKMKAFIKTVCYNPKIRHLKCHREWDEKRNRHKYPNKYDNETGELNPEFNKKYLEWARTQGDPEY